jgi:hypothetical protein
MATHKSNAYSANARIQELQARVLALETANKSLRSWVESELQTRIHDEQNHIQSALDVQFREEQATLAEFKSGIKDGVDGRDGQSIVGPRGERGDVAVVTESELSEAVLRLRKQHAKFLGALQHARELNNQEPSAALRRVIENILSIIERTAL